MARGCGSPGFFISGPRHARAPHRSPVTAPATVPRSATQQDASSARPRRYLPRSRTRARAATTSGRRIRLMWHTELMQLAPQYPAIWRSGTRVGHTASPFTRSASSICSIAARARCMPGGACEYEIGRRLGPSYTVRGSFDSPLSYASHRPVNAPGRCVQDAALLFPLAAILQARSCRGSAACPCAHHG